MNHTFTPGTYKTKNGETAVITGIREDADSVDFPLVGYIIGLPHAYSWRVNGQYDFGLGHDLIPNTKKVWLNLYPADGTAAKTNEGWDVVGVYYETQEDADGIPDSYWQAKRLLCVEQEIPV